MWKSGLTFGWRRRGNSSHKSSEREMHKQTANKLQLFLPSTKARSLLLPWPLTLSCSPTYTTAPESRRRVRTETGTSTSVGGRRAKQTINQSAEYVLPPALALAVGGCRLQGDSQLRCTLTRCQRHCVGSLLVRVTKRPLLSRTCPLFTSCLAGGGNRFLKMSGASQMSCKKKNQTPHFPSRSRQAGGRV